MRVIAYEPHHRTTVETIDYGPFVEVRMTPDVIVGVGADGSEQELQFYDFGRCVWTDMSDQDQRFHMVKVTP
jgi:hypothetical protein